MPIEPLDSDTVRVRWLSTEAAGPVHISRWREMLDAGERARADRFRFTQDRDAFIAAHALTRAMLSGATERPIDSWHYVTGRYGKPSLPTDRAESGLHFNLSHTRGLAACAIARDEIGVDVEASDRRTDFAIADRYFAPEEVLIVRSVPAERKAVVFFRLWTLKEAFIKATGEGLSRPLDSFSFALDPVHISFHPGRDNMQHRDDPAAWQFVECCPVPDRPLALAIWRSRGRSFRLDARAAWPEEVGRQEAIR